MSETTNTCRVVGPRRLEDLCSRGKPLAVSARRTNTANNANEPLASEVSSLFLGSSCFSLNRILKKKSVFEEKISFGDARHPRLRRLRLRRQNHRRLRRENHRRRSSSRH